MDKESSVDSVITQTCFKYYYSDDPENYDICAIIRSYKDMDWSIQILDSMLETSNYDNLEGVTEYLSGFYKVEQVNLEDFMAEVIKVNKELGRWGF